MAEFVTATDPLVFSLSREFGGGWACQEVLQNQQIDVTTGGCAGSPIPGA